MTTGAEWVHQARRLVDTFLTVDDSPPAPEGGSGAAHSENCRWCPVCQVAAVARGERPEVSAALADVLAATAGMLRTFAAEGTDGRAATSPEAEAEAAGEAGDAPDEEPGPAVQWIEIA